jgi:hypothetical protein
MIDKGVVAVEIKRRADFSRDIADLYVLAIQLPVFEFEIVHFPALIMISVSLSLTGSKRSGMPEAHSPICGIFQ